MKKSIYKILAATFALAIIAASPAATITSHALGFYGGARDNTDYGTRPDDYGEGGGSTTEEKSEPAPAPKAEDSGSGSSGGSSNESYQEPVYDGGNEQNNNVQDNNVQDNNKQPKNNPNDVTTSVEGSQSFRSVMNKDHTVYEVYHKGVSVAAFTVTDNKGNTVTFSAVNLEKGEDGLWYLNITLPAGVDVKGLTVTLTKGDLAYLAKELGVTGIQLNGKVMLLTASKTNEEKAPAAGTEKSDKKEAETPTTETPATGSESKAVGARVCWCGYKIDIAKKGGLSTEEKAAWSVHALTHIVKGERTNYTDIAY